MTWKADERHRKSFGPFEMVPERNADSETAHLVTLHDGRQVRVLPDGDTSGQKRSQTIVKALKALHAVWAADTDEGALFAATDEDGRTLLLDATTVLVGFLATEHLSWEYVSAGGHSIGDFLAAWFSEEAPRHMDNPERAARSLLTDIGLDDWEIVRKGQG